MCLSTGGGGVCSGGVPCRGDVCSRGGVCSGGPGPGGCACSRRGGVGIPACTEADTPPPGETATAASYWNAFLLKSILLISATLCVLEHKRYDFLFTGWLYDATGQYDTSFYTAGAWILVSGLILLPLAASCLSHSDFTEQQPPIEEALI